MRFENELDEYLVNAVTRDDPGAVRHLVGTGANLHMQVNHHGDRLLHLAAEHKAFHAADALLQIGVPVDCVNEKGETALFSAIRNNDPDMIAFLAGHRANLNHEDPMGITPLMYAACVGHHDNFAQLLSLGANKDYRNRQGMSVHVFATNQALCDILDGSEAIVSPARLVAFLSRQNKDLPPPQCLL